MLELASAIFAGFHVAVHIETKQRRMKIKGL